MPYYANAGEAFWGGANSGASMASKWVSAFKYGDEYRSNKDFEEEAKGAMDAYNKGAEEAKAIEDVSQREARMQELLKTRNAQINRAALNLGSKGGKVASQYISNLDAADQNVSNETYRRNQRELYAENPRKYTNPTGAGSTSWNPQTGFASNSPNTTTWNETAAFGQDLMSGNEMALKVGSPWGLNRKNDGGLYFDIDGQSGAAQMPGMFENIGVIRGFAGTAYGY